MVIGIANEFEGADFGDKRLGKRLIKISDGFVRNSEKSIPESFESWAEVKGAYRFTSNPKVSRQEILNSHISKTEERVKEHETILAAQDKTSLNFSSHKKTGGLGYLDQVTASGIILHTTLATTEQGNHWEYSHNRAG